MSTASRFTETYELNLLKDENKQLRRHLKELSKRTEVCMMDTFKLERQYSDAMDVIWLYQTWFAEHGVEYKKHDPQSSSDSQ